MRLKSLDALRGIAALTVVLSHCALVPRGSEQSPFLTFASDAGRPSVILFFVLSGFVLTRSLTGVPDFPTFALRRLCRLWLPCAASVLLAAAACYAIGGMPTPTSDWVHRSWTALSPTIVLRHLLMTGFRPDGQLNGVLWSLVYEIRISMLVPFLAVLAVRFPAAIVALSLVPHIGFAALSGCDLHCRPLWAWSTASSLMMTGYFVVFFALGIVAALAPPSQLIASISSSAKTTLVGVCVAILLLHTPDLAMGMAAVLLIRFAVEWPAFREVLERPIPLWLGRVSYSLYLVHLIVLFSAVRIFADAVPNWLVVGLVPPIALLAAAIFHRFVEAPSIALGRAIKWPRYSPRTSP